MSALEGGGTKFWPPTPYFQCTDTRFRFINLDYFKKDGMLVAHMQPPFSDGFDGMTQNELIQCIIGVLKKMFGPSVPDMPERYYVTRWHEDPFAGAGSYSYV